MATKESNKKKRSTVINNIEQLNLEIDYDKLAEAIVKAQEKAKEIEKDEKSKEKIGFFRSIWSILRGKSSSDGSLLSAPFAIIVSLVFRCMAIFGFLATVFFVVAVIITLTHTTWQGLAIAANIVSILLLLCTIVSGVLLSVIFWGAANDAKHERDKSLIISVFSGLISFAALVIAIIALVKGMG